MEHLTNNKIAGFWIRLLARIIDIFCLMVISTFFGWLFLEKNVANDETKWIFKEYWFFYIYAFIVILTIFLLFILLPMFFQGKTIGHWITRTKIVSHSNLRRGILKREIFWSWSWIFCAILTTIFINHTLIDKFVSSNASHDNKFTNWETMRISLVSSIASIITFMQIILAISIIVKPNKIALHDYYSATRVVYINKFFSQIDGKNEIDEILKPQRVENVPINFME